MGLFFSKSCTVFYYQGSFSLMDQLRRHYLDYNSTAPLSKRVRDKISNQLYPEGNPSSIHSEGKNVLKHINDVTRYLFYSFSISDHEYYILYHSGATEGVNTILGGRQFVWYSACDHPCVTNLLKGKDGARLLEVDTSGRIHNLRDTIQNFKILNGNDELWINLSWMNNETGVVENLIDILELKKEFDFKIHIDAVQTVGKITNWNQLSSCVDAYTYSGHKFGALKGIGFSFIKNNIKIKPLLLGGGQQKKMRSGTLNSYGIFSLKDALMDFESSISDASASALLKLKNELIVILKSFSMIIIDNDSFNTICFIHPDLKSDELLIHFDLHGLCVSSGSACSSGSVESSQVLKAMGFGDFAKHSIRISLGKENLEDGQEIKEKLLGLFKKLDRR